ncbi:hypothetical protein [Thiocapsa marina]|uniref:Uncharacterized protein n=1 Tax=Thiocapsa marina 5811 TaxID=768671 RepID=F9U5B4_9GAMM|nr:hypothetical protein [Thiocapsa marina]EGV20337.1 hypothetical protein ThimaDRAFT_0115 [Thiocapsa marina 5811]
MSDAPFELVDAKDNFIDSDWFHQCRETRTPFVVVRSGEHSADVLWDYITLPPECDAALRENLPALERDARAIFDRYAIPESYLRVKATLIGFDRLPFDRAKSAAAELYNLIAAYLPPAAEAVPAGTMLHDAHAETDARRDTAASTSRRLWVEAVSTSSAA